MKPSRTGRGNEELAESRTSQDRRPRSNRIVDERSDTASPTILLLFILS
jgi:hypothetical protein